MNRVRKNPVCEVFTLRQMQVPTLVDNSLSDVIGSSPLIIDNSPIKNFWSLPWQTRGMRQGNSNDLFKLSHQKGLVRDQVP